MHSSAFQRLRATPLQRQRRQLMMWLPPPLRDTRIQSLTCFVSVHQRSRRAVTAPLTRDVTAWLCSCIKHGRAARRFECSSLPAIAMDEMLEQTGVRTAPAESRLHGENAPASPADQAPGHILQSRSSRDMKTPHVATRDIAATAHEFCLMSHGQVKAVSGAGPGRIVTYNDIACIMSGVRENRSGSSKNSAGQLQSPS